MKSSWWGTAFSLFLAACAFCPCDAGAAPEKGFEIGGEKIVLDLSAAELAPEEVRQEFRPARHGRDDANVTPIQPIDGAAWIWHPNVAAHGGAGSAWFVRFVKEFEADASPLRFDVSGDERFVLILDGKPVAFGPHRGFEENWLYQTYEAKLAPGRHVMEAVVWVMGPHAPSAQLHWRGGFILKAEGAYHDKLTTGVADWHVARLRNTKMLPAGMRGAYGVGSECEVRGCSFIDDRPTRPYYDKASVVRGPVRGNPNGLRMPGWLLYPTPLPDQTHERIRPGTFVAARDTFGTNVFYRAEDAGHPAVAGLNALMKEGRPFVVQTNTVLCAVIDLGDYYCAYPELTTVDGKGAEIRWTWAESLKYDRRRKGNRDEFVCKAFLNELSDRFFPDGRSDAFFTTPWWRTGRWCQIEIKTADKPLTIASLSMSETRYPIEVESHFRCDDPSLDDVQRICRRGMEMALHENMCDGPHYEQHQYPGDTLVQAAAMRALTGDGRLAMRAIEIFDHARRDNGMLPMNFPTAGVQESATYTMVWPLMLRDCVMWHETDEKWLKARMPGLLHTIAGIAVYENGEGLLENLPGWCFQDWVPNWGDGVGPGGKRGRGVSAFNNLFYLLAVQAAAEVADTAGDAPLAAYWRGKAEALARRIVAKFMDTAAGVLCDSSGTERFSEHVQSLAILAGVLTSAQEAAAVKAVDSGRTADGKPLSKATNYFCHYLFGACAKAGRTDIILKRLDHWRAYSRYGLRTPLEDDDFDAKSDCHAWASHPIFHLHSAIAGVTPAEPFFRTVRVAPQPGGLKRIDAATPHPKGLIETRLAFDGDSVSGEVVLPDGVTGEFLWRGKSLPLHGGANKIDMK